METKETKEIIAYNSKGEKIKLTVIHTAEELDRVADEFIRKGVVSFEPNHIHTLRIDLVRNRHCPYSFLKSIVEIEDGVYVNSDNIEAVSKKKAQSIPEDKKDYFAVKIHDVRDLSLEEAKALQEKHPKGVCIKVNDNRFLRYAGDTYSLNDYIQIMEKFQQIVGGIDHSLSEKERFGIIYKRVCNSMIYNHEVVGAKTLIGKWFAESQKFTARNYDALISHRGVCASFSYALDTACKLDGIKSMEVHGIVDTIVDDEEQKNNHGKFIRKMNLGKRGFERGYHAWNKVRLDGEWFNVDPTFDKDEMRNGVFPSYALLSDRDMIRTGRSGFGGPRCKITADDDTIRKMMPGIDSQSHRDLEIDPELSRHATIESISQSVMAPYRKYLEFIKYCADGIIDFNNRFIRTITGRTIKQLPAASRAISQVESNKMDSNFISDVVEIKGEQLQTVLKNQRNVAGQFAQNQGNNQNHKGKEEEMSK